MVAPPAPCLRQPVCLRRLLLLLLVAGLFLGIACAEYSRFLEVHRSLWVVSTHDRNAHYLYALRLATAARNLDALGFLELLNKARVWPPLHGLICSAVLTVGGPDYRLAVLPNLFAWAGSAFLAFLIARRALTVGGTAAGLLAGLFLLVSPMHRSLATDIMLESLGAFLTLACLLAYLVAVQEDTLPSWRNLSITLTLLFLEKYPYWTIVFCGLALSELIRRPEFYASLLRQGCERLRAPSVWRRELLHPINWLILAVGLLSAFLAARGDRPLVLAGRSFTVYPPENVVSIASLLLLIRLVSWWRAARDFRATLPEWLTRLLHWHVWPVVVFLCLPKHLSPFLWYMSPANTGPNIQLTWAERAAFYLHHAVEHYHLNEQSFLLAAGLFGLALLTVKLQKPGALSVLLVALVGALLTATHPNRQGRFLHSWIGAFWLGAAFGASGLGLLPHLLGRRRLAISVAALAVLPVLAFHAPGLIQPHRSAEGGPVPALPSLLDVTDCFARDLDSSGKATVLATVPVRFLTQWTTLERQGRLDRLEDYWFGFAHGQAGEANREKFRHWLEAPTSDTLVFLDRLPAPELFWEEVGDVRFHEELRDLLAGQHAFRLVKEVPFPRQGCKVQVWRRTQDVGSRDGTKE